MLCSLRRFKVFGKIGYEKQSQENEEPYANCQMIVISELYRTFNHIIIIIWYWEMFIFHENFLTAIVKNHIAIKII